LSLATPAVCITVSPTCPTRNKTIILAAAAPLKDATPGLSDTVPTFGEIKGSSTDPLHETKLKTMRLTYNVIDDL
jgi:hypothetical protein